MWAMCGCTLSLLLGAAAADESVWRSDRLSVRNESMALRYYLDGVRVSPWHDVPYLAGDDSATGRPLLHFVCEIPRGVSAKVEIHKSVPYNDLVQDVNKDGSPRYYTYSPSTVNYGAIPQTWEDPHHADAHTGLGGDNDPIDVLQLNEGSCVAGAVQRVRVLGALALVDGGETDWKLLVVDVDAADAPAWRELGDVPAERVNEVREWFRLYKTSDGKPPNEYGLNGEPIDAAAALAVAAETHALWGGAGRARCEFGGEPCWGMEARRSVDWRSAGAAVFALLAVAQLYFIVTAVQRKRRALAAASPKKKR